MLLPRRQWLDDQSYKNTLKHAATYALLSVIAGSFSFAVWRSSKDNAAQLAAYGFVLVSVVATIASWLLLGRGTHCFRRQEKSTTDPPCTVLTWVLTISTAASGSVVYTTTDPALPAPPLTVGRPSCSRTLFT